MPLDLLWPYGISTLLAYNQLVLPQMLNVRSGVNWEICDRGHGGALSLMRSFLPTMADKHQLCDLMTNDPTATKYDGMNLGCFLAEMCKFKAN